jgi:DNA-binding transcriptional regulator YhcF (GntR family)
VTLPKYAQVAESIRAQIADGKLTPGQPAPSGAALARATGYSTLTCRRALRILINDEILVPGTSPNARPRVRGRATRREQTLADAARALSASLARHRHAAGLTQPQLAVITGVSVTTIGHAETGRLWQSRNFWERADKSLNVGGELLAFHDVYRAVSAAPPFPGERALNADGELLSRHDAHRAATAVAPSSVGLDETNTAPAVSPCATQADISAPVCVTITWANGTITTVYPPREARRPQQSPPPDKS